MRECEIDLVAEHRLASSTGLAPADTLLGPGVSGPRALPGKALIYLLPLSQRRQLTLKVSASVRAPGSDHSLRSGPHGSPIKENVFVGQVTSRKTDVAASGVLSVLLDA